MPEQNLILNLPGFAIKKVKGYDPLILEVEYYRKVRCIHCNGRHLRKKSKYHRTVKHESIGMRKVLLSITGQKFYCYSCKRYFNQQFPGICKWQRSTERLRNQVFQQHSAGVSQKDIASWMALGKATVERWYHRYYERQYREYSNRPCPLVLGIDEHSFSRKQGYATTFCDLRKHRIFDVVKGRDSRSLEGFLLSLEGREKVQVVCMDLSSTYRSLVRKYFPNARIVADRFHVIRLINQMFIKTSQTIDTSMKNNRAVLAYLRTNPENLSPAQTDRRKAYFKQFPAIAALYQFKQEIHQLLMHKRCTAKKCRQLIPFFLSYISQLKSSAFPALRTLGNTLSSWQEEIARMWRFTKSNGITEGFHRKMKLIQRRAYGFRNFENYRLRVIVLCA